MELTNKNIMLECSKSKNENIKNLPENLNFLKSFLENEIPSKFNISILNIKTFEEIFKENPNQGTFLYWKEMDKRIELLWTTTGLKCKSIIKTIIDSINSGNYLSAIILIRALFENTAILHYYIWKIISTYNKIKSDENIKKIIKGEVMGTFISSELEDILILYSHVFHKTSLL